MVNEATSPEVSSYRIIFFPGAKLPESYKSVVFSRWLRSLRFGNDYFKLIDSDSYYPSYHGYIESLIAHPLCIISFAVLSDDEDVVLGWSVQRGNVLDYVHVQKDYRRNYISTALVNPTTISRITHLTKTGMSIWASKLSSAKFNPFA